jgi:hypothetical protein
MRELDHPPDAPSLLESMRSIGYSLESALADIVDNSIAAKAKNINIEFRPGPTPYVAILDDGLGMTHKGLEQAMRHGSTNPSLARESSDLGRYGLGLKTASLSQCRQLTVVSKKEGKLSGYRWDLDIVLARNAWTLLKLNSKDMASLPHVDELSAKLSGTLVIWHVLDRMMAGESSVEASMGRQMAIAGDQLSIVFHRYLIAEPGHGAINISFNKNPLKAIDPFLQDHKATQRLPEDVFSVGGVRIHVKPFILPHLSKLKSVDIARAGGAEGLRHQQGFYVYRNRRLIIWGTWFRLAKKDELSKLARVRVDIPNSLDHLWTIDVKKSAAVPPEAVRLNLRRTIEKIRQASGRTLIFRGRTTTSVEHKPAWNEVRDREGFRFDVNREHPIIDSLRQSLNARQRAQLESLLKVLERSFPAEALYVRFASDQGPDTSEGEASLRALIKEVFDGSAENLDQRRVLMESLHLMEPFSGNVDFTRKIARQLLEG